VNIILFGPPGAGKGTQAIKLSKEYKLKKVSTGDLLRKEIENKSKIGQEVELLINKGKLVSDDTINSLLKNTLSEKNFKNNFIFDGYPRNLSQAENLEKLINSFDQKISSVFYLNVDRLTIIKRVLGRQICNKCGKIFNKFFLSSKDKDHICGDKFLQKRTDDDEKVISDRYETYLKETTPVLDYYEKQNLLYKVNGKAKIEEIYREITAILNTLNT